jgi:carbon storage regulator CsrA
MLVISRKRSESLTLILPDQRKIVIVAEKRPGSSSIRVGIDAPQDVKIHRTEKLEGTDAGRAA